MPSSSKSDDNGNGSQGSDGQANGSRVDGGQEAKLTASFTSIEVSDGRGETRTLTEQVMTERTEMRRSPTENYAGSVSGSMFRLKDTNPYTNEMLFSPPSEKKG